MKKDKYYVNPELVATGQRGGSLPDGHPRRCQGTSKRTRQQCGKVALKNKRHCEFHGGRQGYTKNRTKVIMAGIYSERLKGTLLKKLEEIQGMDEITSLDQEVELSRVMLLQAVEAYSIVSEDKTMEDTIKNQLLSRCEVQLRNSLNHVKEMVSSMAKVKTLVGATIDPQNIHLFAEQVTRILHDNLRDVIDDTKLETIIEQIRDAKIIESSSTGISLTIEA